MSRRGGVPSPRTFPFSALSYRPSGAKYRLSILRIPTRFYDSDKNPSILRILIQTKGTCRPSGAKGRSEFAGDRYVMSAVVGAGFPRPMGWGTQPLRIQPSRFLLYPCNPLILRILIQTKSTCRPSGAKGRSEFAGDRYVMSAVVGAGFPRPMGWGTQPLRIQPSRFLLYPCNPSIQRILIQTKSTCRPSGAKGRSEFAGDRYVMSAVVGAGFPRPMGWGTQPLRIQPSRFLLYPCNPSIQRILIQTKGTYRPSGAKGRSEFAGDRYVMSAVVGAGFPRPMGWGTQPLRIQPSRFPAFNPVNP